MPHYNLPHNHGQNMERVLNKMPHTEDFTDIAFLFQQLGDPTRRGYYGFCAIATNVSAILRRLLI